MKALHQNKNSLLTVFLVIILSSLILVSIGRTVHFTFFTKSGGIDFHSYWFSGLFIHQNSDPYAAFLSGQTPNLPITFITGEIEFDSIRNPNLAHTPANTAPMVLLLSLFSWLPWQTAKTIWFFLNLFLILLLPLLVIRYLTPIPRMPRKLVLLTCLIVYALKGTRAALGTGQTTILVLTLMVLAFAINKKSWLVSGLLLGIALSKYSVALPVFLFFLYKRQFKILGVSLLIQLIGVFIISWIGNSPPLSVMQSYYKIMLVHINLPGIHLGDLFPPDSSMRIIGPFILTIVVAGIFIYQQLRNRDIVSDKFIDLHTLAILSLWTLLVAYHRPYDGIMIIFFIVLIMHGLSKTNRWQLSTVSRIGLIVYFSTAMLMLILPYEQIGSLIPWKGVQAILEFIAKTVILTLVSMLGVTFWFRQKAYDENGR
jgi:hypothetical protein